MCLVTLGIPECDTREIHQPTNGNHLNGNERVFKCLNCLVLHTSYKWEKKLVWPWHDHTNTAMVLCISWGYLTTPKIASENDKYMCAFTAKL